MFQPVKSVDGLLMVVAFRELRVGEAIVRLSKIVAVVMRFIAGFCIVLCLSCVVSATVEQTGLLVYRRVDSGRPLPSNLERHRMSFIIRVTIADCEGLGKLTSWI